MIGRLIKSFVLSPSGKLLVESLDRVPVIRSWQRCTFDYHFDKITPYSRMFRGVYGSFAEARLDIPPEKAGGYDTPDAAVALPSCGRPFTSDYPVMFWLARLTGPGTSMFDFGGYVGTSYYTYLPYLSFLQDLRWTVCDLPSITQRGNEIAAARKAVGLSFTNEVGDANGYDVFLVSGSMQFVEESLGAILGRMKAPPRHVIVNKLPAYEGEQFVTLNNIGPSTAPYWIFNRSAFVEDMKSAGYLVVDEWKNPEFSCRIPFHREIWVPAYTGFYFCLKA